jgi:tetratricopeptide (TPR) repeat protein
MDEYDRKLAEESTGIVDRGAPGYGGGQSRHLVGRTWQLSLDALAEQGLPEATTLLRLLSLLAADPVPLCLLVALREVAAEGLEPALPLEQLEPALRGLLDHSLVELVDADRVRCVRAHGVLLDSVAAGTPQAQRPALAAVAAGLLEAVSPEPGAESPEIQRLLALLAPHAAALLTATPGERTSEVAVRVVRGVFDSGDFAGALALAPGIADKVEESLGEQHPVSMEARDVEARALFRMGHYRESEALHRRILQRREVVRGPDHLDTLRSCFGLQAPLHLQGRYEEAEHFLRRALEGQRRVLGEDSIETLNTWVILTEVLPALGKKREFEAETEALLRSCERALPPDHLTAVIARHNRAEGLRILERYEEAETLAHQVLDDRIRLQGPDHPLALSALCLTARVAHGLGRHDAAIAVLKEVIERRERVLGPEHPFVVENRTWLGEWQAEAES